MRWGVLFVQTATVRRRDTAAMLPAPPDAALSPILMFVFGCAVTDDEIYRECAEPGIRLAAEPDSEIRPLGTAGTIFRNYNLYFDEYKDREDIEALVLVHQDAEIVDPDFCSKVRKALQDEEVALVGCAGAIGVRSIAWWEGSVVWASYVHRFRRGRRRRDRGDDVGPGQGAVLRPARGEVERSTGS